MGMWDERAGWVSAAEHTARLSGLLDNLPDPETQEQAGHLERLRQIVAALEARLDGQPSLVADATLSGLTTSLGQVIAQVDAARANEDLAHLANAMTPSDAVVNGLGAWPAPAAPDSPSAKKAAAGLRKDAEAMVAALKQRVDALQEALNASQRADAERVQKADAALEELTDKIDAEAARVTEQSARLDKLLTDTTSAAADAETSRGQQATDALAKHEQDVQAKIAEIDERATTAQQADQERAAQVLKTLGDLEDQAKKVVASTASRVIAGDYGEWAEEQRNSAKMWNALAVGAALCAFAFAVIVAAAWNEDAGWHSVAYKIGGTLTLLVLAGYAGTRATEHRREERLAKRTQLSLDALDPFLATFEPAEKRDIKDRLVDQFFAAPQQAERRKDDGKQSSNTLADLAAALAALAQQQTGAK